MDTPRFLLLITTHHCLFSFRIGQTLREMPQRGSLGSWSSSGASASRGDLRSGRGRPADGSMISNRFWQILADLTSGPAIQPDHHFASPRAYPQSLRFDSRLQPSMASVEYYRTLETSIKSLLFIVQSGTNL